MWKGVPLKRVYEGHLLTQSHKWLLWCSCVISHLCLLHRSTFPPRSPDPHDHTLCFREHFPNACFCWPHQLRLLSEELKLVSSLDGPSNGKDLEPGGQDLGPNLTPVYMLLSSKHITSLSLSFLIYKMRDTSITCQRFCQLPGTPPRYHGFNSRPLK